MIEIASEKLSAVINPHGAELWALHDAEGRSLMTDADPAFWTGHAPLLFPIIGALNGGHYRLDGKAYPLPQHEFARRKHFEIIEQGAGAVRLRLTDDDETRAVYPFAFALEASYRLDGATLAIDIAVTNRSEGDMPASFGLHPAFAWPLPYGAEKTAHRVRFAQEEPDPIKRLDAGLIVGEVPTPVHGRDLALDDALFVDDALIWAPVHSQSLHYGVPDEPQLAIAFPDTPMLGIWTKPGARFLCVEPWHGLADPAGFEGEIWDKPGIMRFVPGETRHFKVQVTLES